MQIVGRRAERREIGKSTLIDAAVEALEGFTVLRAAGTEFEQDLLYAARHQLCGPTLDQRARLPVVRQRALEAVFGLGRQTSPDPVCCVVDDAQWIDDASRQALVFVARRRGRRRAPGTTARCSTGSWPKRAETPWRYWNSPTTAARSARPGPERDRASVAEVPEAEAVPVTARRTLRHHVDRCVVR
ncbi:ATP-binding protein [Amycolatopsis sp. NBC_00345]|uniref:hypothetical protein n=1 Tax=Amycolatopsis sp. NBC_00345 TaxID=2975955 RepID=UPI002E26CA69